MDERGRVSRRSLVLAGAGLAAAGGVAAVRVVGWNDALHRVGLDESPDRHVPPAGAPVKTERMQSAAMKRAVRVGVSAPDNPRGLVICLHGRGGSYRNAFETVQIHHFVAAAREPIAVVGVDGGSSSYWHRRASGIDPQAMLHDELLPRLDARFGVLPKAIVGWSMGGYGALLAAERHPDIYAAVVASSPALFTSAEATAEGAFDDAEDYRRHDVFRGVEALRALAVRVDCGTGDPFISAARAFAAELPRPNLGAFSRGYHDAAYWRSVAPAQIATIAAALGL